MRLRLSYLITITSSVCMLDSFILSSNTSPCKNTKLRKEANTVESEILSNTEITLEHEAVTAKEELIRLGESTNRGFTASREQKNRAKDLAKILNSYNPTAEPARQYYETNSNNSNESSNTPEISGKWTLIYTDAPDITGLDAGPFSTAKLGRIGQECSPPFIKNVIEWRQPDWALSLPFVGSPESRVLQKVVCEAYATPKKPCEIDLTLVGLDLKGVIGDKERNSFMNDPGKFFEQNPLELRGLVKAPFGKCEVLFLDHNLRIIRTYQNYLAVNIRSEDEWF